VLFTLRGHFNPDEHQVQIVRLFEAQLFKKNHNKLEARFFLIERTIAFELQSTKSSETNEGSRLDIFAHEVNFGGFQRRVQCDTLIR